MLLNGQLNIQSKNRLFKKIFWIRNDKHNHFKLISYNGLNKTREILAEKRNFNCWSSSGSWFHNSNALVFHDD